jgi:transcriptional regulator with XRE-family HTH domain
LDAFNHPDLKPVVGRVVARFRAERGTTQEKLAEAAGLDVGYISLIERGHRMPTVDTIFRLCHGLDASPSELIREVEKQVAGIKITPDPF